jgi:ABC-type uncharacterized transport system permease subunit
MAPSTGQLVLLLAAILLYGIGGVLSVLRAHADAPQLQSRSRLFLVLGIVASLGVIIWHAAARGSWLPLEDNFDALLWLATLLALFVLYVQRTRRLGGIDWFVMPVVLLLLIASLFVGPHTARYVSDAWSWVHRVSAYGGALAFAIAAASGAMYVLTSRRLRSKSPIGPLFGSLERLEHLTMIAVTLGFALLTIGMITGGVEIIGKNRHTSLAKIVFAAGVWIVYAVVLHAPINPSFRGRKVALLSIAGFVLMIGAIITVLLLPGASGAPAAGGTR